MHHILSKKLQLFSMELPKLKRELQELAEIGKPLEAQHWWGKFLVVLSTKCPKCICDTYGCGRGGFEAVFHLRKD